MIGPQMAPRAPAITGAVEHLPPGTRGRGGVVCFPLSVLRLEAVVGDDPERVAIREGLAFGKALHELLRLPLVAERGQPTRVRPRVEPPSIWQKSSPSSDCVYQLR